jgi:hypothetical protein
MEDSKKLMPDSRIAVFKGRVLVFELKIDETGVCCFSHPTRLFQREMDISALNDTGS